jgi:hypothetical protein
MSSGYGCQVDEPNNLDASRSNIELAYLEID